MGDCNPESSERRSRLVAVSAEEDRRRLVLGEVGGEGTTTAEETGLYQLSTTGLEILRTDDLRAGVCHLIGTFSTFTGRLLICS